MIQELNCILFIDDNEADNFFHRIVLQEAGFSGKLLVYESVADALKFLKEVSETDPNRPELIFLDINLPGMTGWDFLKSFEQLPISQHQAIPVVLLSTVLTPRDEEKGAAFPIVRATYTKPLTSACLKKLANMPEGKKRC